LPLARDRLRDPFLLLAKNALATNRLIGALPARNRQRFLDGCEPVNLEFSEVLAEPEARIRHVYFPTGSIISLTRPIDDRASLEVGLVGNEGMLGASLILGVDISPVRAVVQGEGPALRMRSALFRRELRLIPSLQGLLNRYLYVQLDQLAQTVACTRFHVVEKRLARLLLMIHDRAHSDTFHVTQEFLASMLGVRRVGVTKAATSLQRKGLIRYSRGNVMVLDRAGLNTTSCDCYEADNAIYARMMGNPVLKSAFVSSTGSKTPSAVRSANDKPA